MTSFPGYQVVQELGTGGFATVHLATQDSTGEAFAIKQFTSTNGSEKGSKEVDVEKSSNEHAVRAARASTRCELALRLALRRHTRSAAHSARRLPLGRSSSAWATTRT
jgi:serine/threonine protein kinase